MTKRIDYTITPPVSGSDRRIIDFTIEAPISREDFSTLVHTLRAVYKKQVKAGFIFCYSKEEFEACIQFFTRVNNTTLTKSF